VTPWARPVALFVGLALGTASFAPCAGATPPPIAPGERPEADSTEAELWYGMDRAEQELRHLPHVERDAALNAYVREVLCRVAGPHCGDLRLYVVTNPEFNASMAPNGATLVFTGALLRLRSEDELAMLLGHEFAHYRQRHSLQQWRASKRSGAALGTFGVATLGAGVGLVGGVAELAGAAGLSGFSRDHEREADALGFEFAAAQGYVPGAGLALWERLAQEEAATIGRRRHPVFASHPATADRVEAHRRMATDAAVVPPLDLVAQRRERYQAVIEPFLDGWLSDELTRRRYAASIQMIGALHADAPPDWRGRTAHYLGEAHRLRRGEGDAAKAAALQAEAVAAPDAPPAAFREHGYALRAAGDAAGARDALARYLSLRPDAPDRAFVERDLGTLSP
jgi:predicted Zn-dependent protease